MSRYVVLEHRPGPNGPRPRHWDLLVEQDEAGPLLAWAWPVAPLPGPPLEVEALPDHRREYLDYEGPINGGRGQVRRWDQGRYTPLSWQQERRVLALQGARLRGVLTLRRPDPALPHRWIGEWSADSSASWGESDSV